VKVRYPQTGEVSLGGYLALIFPGQAGVTGSVKHYSEVGSMTKSLLMCMVMAVFAVIFRLWPTMKRGMLASVQFWLTVTGLAGIQIGGVQQTLNGSVLLLASGSGVMIAGTLLLGWLFYDRATA